MANRFSSIGFPVESRRELDALAEQLLPKCEEHRTRLGRYLRYASGCGAELWFQLDPRDELVGVTPCFAGDARLRVELTAAVERPDETPLDGALHASLASSRDGPSFVFDCPDYRTYGRIAFPAIARASIAAFARELSCYRSFEEFRAVQPAGSTLASQSFVPSGLFSADGERIRRPHSEALFAGYVRSAERRTNPMSGRPFFAAEVESCAGVFHVVADPELVPQLVTVGDVLFGSFWLCGRLVERPVTRSARGPARALDLARRLLRR